MATKRNALANAAKTTIQDEELVIGVAAFHKITVYHFRNIWFTESAFNLPFIRSAPQHHTISRLQISKPPHGAMSAKVCFGDWQGKAYAVRNAE